MRKENWRDAGTKPLVTTILIGLMAGLVAVGFAAGASWIQAHTLEIAARQPLWVFAIFAVLLVCAGALVAGVLMRRFAPDAAGSGIPQVKAAYQRGELDFSWRLIFVKFFGGVLSIGTGSSLGREGPTVHISAALASKLARGFRETKEAQMNAICAGSAAGLAVAFNSPLAGVTLVLEEIAGGKDQHKFAGRSLLAAALGVLVVYLFRGSDQAAFAVRPGIPLSWPVIWLSPVVALVAGGAGLLFQWTTMGLRARMKTSRIPAALRPASGALVGAVAGVAAFALTGHLGVFGLGEQDLLAALQNQILWQAAACLLVAKIVATVFCYGAGGCGGIFAPLVFFGGMSGTVVFGLAAPWLHLSDGDQTMLSIVGMTACLCAVVRAPITSILIVTEMTREVYVLPALMVAAVIGAYLNRYVLGENLYDQALRQDGVALPEEK
jgi:CIC family chloride channel protein